MKLAVNRARRWRSWPPALGAWEDGCWHLKKKERADQNTVTQLIVGANCLSNILHIMWVICVSTEKRNQFVQLAPLALTSYLTGNESVSCVSPPFKTAFHCYLLYNGQEMKEKHLRAEVNTDTRLLFFWLLSEIVEQKLVSCETDNIRRKARFPSSAEKSPDDCIKHSSWLC